MGKIVLTEQQLNRVIKKTLHEVLKEDNINQQQQNNINANADNQLVQLSKQMTELGNALNMTSERCMQTSKNLVNHYRGMEQLFDKIKKLMDFLDDFIYRFKR